jgi:hypothetical protein
MVDGKEVREDRPVLSPLPARPGRDPIAFRGMKLLVLADKSEIFACADCEATGARGEILVHRRDEHGARRGGNRKQSGEPALIASLDPDLTVRELLEQALEIPRWAELFEAQQVQVDELKARCEAAERRNRQIKIHLEKAGFVLKEDEV